MAFSLSHVISIDMWCISIRIRHHLGDRFSAAASTDLLHNFNSELVALIPYHSLGGCYVKGSLVYPFFDNALTHLAIGYLLVVVCTRATALSSTEMCWSAAWHVLPWLPCCPFQTSWQTVMC